MSKKNLKGNFSYVLGLRSATPKIPHDEKYSPLYLFYRLIEVFFK